MRSHVVELKQVYNEEKNAVKAVSELENLLEEWQMRNEGIAAADLNQLEDQSVREEAMQRRLMI